MKTIHHACSVAWVLGLIGITILDVDGLAILALGVITLIGLAGALLLKGGGPYSDEVAEQPVERKVVVAEVVVTTSPQLALPAPPPLAAER